MKSRRYSEEQIVRILGEIGSGRSVAETARQYGVAEATIYRWLAGRLGQARTDVKVRRVAADRDGGLRRGHVAGAQQHERGKVLAGLPLGVGEDAVNLHRRRDERRRHQGHRRDGCGVGRK